MNIKDTLRKSIPTGILGGSLLTMTVLPASAQKLQVYNNAVDCGKVEYKSPATATFKMKNKGNRRLIISDVKVSCGCISADYPKEEIPSGSEFTVKVTYDAKQLGHFFKEACIYSNGSKKPVYLSMKGVVVEEVIDHSANYPYKIGDLRIDKLDLEFDDVNRGDMPVETINVVNDGNTELTPNLMHLPPYLTADYSKPTLRPGEKGKINVTLHSDKVHDLGITQTTIHLANRLGDKVSTENELMASVVLLPSFAQMTDNERLNAPAISLSREKVSMNFSSKDKVTEKVEITNSGKSRLKIKSIHMFSNALRVTLGKTELDPGQKTTLKITAEKQLMEKARVKPRVMMITNDPDKAKVVIRIEK